MEIVQAVLGITPAWAGKATVHEWKRGGNRIAQRGREKERLPLGR